MRVYVRPDGLELGLAKRLVPWASLQAVQNLSAFGGLLLPLYRLTFRDGTAPVMFYACDDVEAVIGRYRAPVERADASGSEPHA